MPPTESRITRIPGAWAERHPVIVAGALVAALGAILAVLAWTGLTVGDVARWTARL